MNIIKGFTTCMNVRFFTFISHLHMPGVARAVFIYIIYFILKWKRFPLQIKKKLPAFTSTNKYYEKHKKYFFLLWDFITFYNFSLSCGTSWHSAGLMGQVRESLQYTKLMLYSCDLYKRLDDKYGIGMISGFKVKVLYYVSFIHPRNENWLLEIA